MGIRICPECNCMLWCSVGRFVISAHADDCPVLKKEKE